MSQCVHMNAYERLVQEILIGCRAERCVSCGAMIPEGRMVCPTCQKEGAACQPAAVFRPLLSRHRRDATTPLRMHDSIGEEKVSKNQAHVLTFDGLD